MKKLLLALFTMAFLSIPTFASINIEDIISGNASESTHQKTAVEIENARTIAISNFFDSSSQIISNYCAGLKDINTQWAADTADWTNEDDKSKRELFEFILTNNIQTMSEVYSKSIEPHRGQFGLLENSDSISAELYASQLIEKYEAIYEILSSAQTKIDSLTMIIQNCDENIDANVENIESKHFYTLLKKLCSTVSTTLGNNIKLIKRSISVLDQSAKKLNPDNFDTTAKITEIQAIADKTWSTVSRSVGFIRLGISAINLFIKIQGKSINPYVGDNVNRQNFKLILEETAEVTNELKTEFSNVANVK